jgi:ABC-type multidrug transport system fused ATPase/permease subunit
MVGERGVRLSGGERQRVAIARIILEKTKILIFDEATSALDSTTEKEIQEAMLEVMQNHTTIIIAHRLSTVKQVDRVIVIEDGQITEEGRHEDLLTKSGKYAELWSHQVGGFLADS